MTIAPRRSAAELLEAGLWQAAQPLPGWCLLWLPLVLVAVDDSPDLAGAMFRLAGVLLLGYLAWATGRGPAGPWAERLFVALSLVAWFAAIGVALWELGSPATLATRLGLVAGLLLGPACVTWAWRRRLLLAPVDRSRPAAAADPRLALLRLAGLVVVAALLLGQVRVLATADLTVVVVGLGLFGLFRVRGRATAAGVLG